MPATASSRRAAPAQKKTERFRNWKLIGLEIIAAALASYLFVAWQSEWLGWIGLVVGILIVLPLSREFRGVAISRRVISLPRGRIARFPILPLRRRLETGTADLRELMVMESWHGFQVVKIEGPFGSELLLFQSRGQRRRFMSAFAGICPNVSITRKRAQKIG
jgi:hypothetical protein